MTPRLARAGSLALLVVLGCARNLRTPPPPASFDGVYHRFPTGLQLAVYEDPTAARVSVTVSYGSGALEDPRGQEGLAHLVEHLSSRARSQGGPSDSISARVFTLGGDENALTTFEETAYVTDIFPAGLGSILAIEAERMRAPLAGITEEELTIERGVVESELYERDFDDNYNARMSTVMRLAFDGHPYGRSVGGSERTLRAIDVASARRWAAAQYTPDNAVIVLSGPLSASEGRALVLEKFGPLASGEGVAHNPPASRLPPDPVQRLSRPATLKIGEAALRNRELWLVWPLPGRDSGEEPRIQAACAALMTSLRRKHGFDERVKDIDVIPFVLDGITVAAAQFTLKPDADPLSFHAQVLRDFEIPAEASWSSDLADRIANSLIAQGYGALHGRIGAEAARYVRGARRSDFAAAWRTLVTTEVTPALYTHARAYFPKDQVRSILLLPRAMAGGSNEQRALAGETTATAGLESLSSEHEDPRAIMPPPPTVETFSLESGLRVVIARHPRLPQAHARVVVRTRAPSSLETPEVAWLGSLVTGDAMANDPFGHGPAGAVVDQSTFPSKDWVSALDRLFSPLRDPRLDEWPFHFLRNSAKSVIRRMGKDPRRKHLGFPESYLLGRAEFDAEALNTRLEGISRSEVLEWLAYELRPQNITLILSGDLPPTEELTRHLEAKFFSWRNERSLLDVMGLTPTPKANLPQTWPEAGPAPRKGRALLYPGKSALTRLQLTLRGPAVAPDEVAAWSVLSSALERRLTENLRERRGISYGVSARHSDWRNASLLTLGTSVRLEHSAEVVALLRETVRELGAAPLSPAELRTARWEVARHFADQFRDMFGIAATLQELAERGAPSTRWASYPDSLAQVTAEQVRQLARQLALEGPALTAAGATSNLEDAFKAQGFWVETVPEAK